MDIPDYIYKFHKKGGHEVSYMVIAQDSGATSYFQYMSLDGIWFIMKSVRSGAITLYTFTAPVSTSSDTGWTNRAGLTYQSFNGAFT